MNKNDFTYTTIVFESQKCGDEDVMKNVELLFYHYFAGREAEYFSWDSNSSGEYYPVIDEFLKSIGITKCLIEYI